MNQNQEIIQSKIVFNLSESKKLETKEKKMSQTLDKLVKQDGHQSNLKNLYQNIGTRVSKLKEINEIYQKKMQNQNSELVNFFMKTEKTR